MLLFSMMKACLLAFVSMATLVACDIASQESPLSDRLTIMEQQLLQQNSVIQNQAAQLSDQGDLNRYLISKLTQQDARLSQQEDRLSQQEKTIKLQDGRLFQQEGKSSQRDQINKLQEIRLSQQEAKLLEQEKIINRQNLKISQQDRTITQLLTKILTPAMSGKPTSHPLAEQDPGNSMTSTHHDVIARSDDMDPLVGVVNEMNQRVTQMTADIQALKNTDIKHTLNIYDARSSSFVRWGSSHCPHNSSLVYSGVVGGSHYNHPGAAVNYLCLTMSPVFASDRSTDYLALLYGGEYSTHDSHQDRDPVCAVCRASFSTTIMVPATNVCTSGWTRLYSGYLMANDATHHAAGSEFVCVDTALESRPGSAHDDNGKLLYFTKTRCGSLPCGPYVNDKVVTCVVCGQ